MAITSEPARPSSARCTDRSPPCASALSTVREADAGPTSTTLISVSWPDSLIRTAASMAWRSYGFSVFSPERTRRFVPGSSRLSAVGSGTSFTQIAIFTFADPPGRLWGGILRQQRRSDPAVSRQPTARHDALRRAVPHAARGERRRPACASAPRGGRPATTASAPRRSRPATACRCAAGRARPPGAATARRGRRDRCRCAACRPCRGRRAAAARLRARVAGAARRSHRRTRPATNSSVPARATSSAGAAPSPTMPRASSVAAS